MGDGQEGEGKGWECIGRGSTGRVKEGWEGQGGTEKVREGRGRVDRGLGRGREGMG